MCTVTFVPSHAGVIITSSRDELYNRGPVLFPEIHTQHATPLIYPTDIKSGGSWFVINNRGTTAVLLNGAFEKYLPVSTYRMSRGKLLIELFNQANIQESIHQVLLKDIEPFTLVLWENKVLQEYRWDGHLLFHKVLDPGLCHIWSSATLYNLTMRSERQQWFCKWLEGVGNPTLRDAIHFHLNTQVNNHEYGIRMHRANGIGTVSITSAHIMPGRVTMVYADLTSNIEYQLETVLPFSPIIHDSTKQYVQLVQNN
jgi:hypothetical protein